ncbi:hypothetical protein OPQ81_000338 [Rhizoctonia solani]|nr:hypothetical protein OPQ81_000338 [Rhizoctonia solani]
MIERTGVQGALWGATSEQGSLYSPLNAGLLAFRLFNGIGSPKLSKSLGTNQARDKYRERKAKCVDHGHACVCNNGNLMAWSKVTGKGRKADIEDPISTPEWSGIRCSDRPWPLLPPPDDPPPPNYSCLVEKTQNLDPESPRVYHCYAIHRSPGCRETGFVVLLEAQISTGTCTSIRLGDFNGLSERSLVKVSQILSHCNKLIGNISHQLLGDEPPAYSSDSTNLPSVFSVGGLANLARSWIRLALSSIAPLTVPESPPGRQLKRIVLYCPPSAIIPEDVAFDPACRASDHGYFDIAFIKTLFDNSATPHAQIDCRTEHREQEKRGAGEVVANFSHRAHDAYAKFRTAVSKTPQAQAQETHDSGRISTKLALSSPVLAPRACSKTTKSPVLLPNISSPSRRNLSLTFSPDRHDPTVVVVPAHRGQQESSVFNKKLGHYHYEDNGVSGQGWVVGYKKESKKWAEGEGKEAASTSKSSLPKVTAESLAVVSLVPSPEDSLFGFGGDYLLWGSYQVADHSPFQEHKEFFSKPSPRGGSVEDLLNLARGLLSIIPESHPRWIEAAKTDLYELDRYYRTGSYLTGFDRSNQDLSRLIEVDLVKIVNGPHVERFGQTETIESRKMGKLMEHARNYLHGGTGKVKPRGWDCHKNYQYLIATVVIPSDTISTPPLRRSRTLPRLAVNDTFFGDTNLDFIEPAPNTATLRPLRHEMDNLPTQQLHYSPSPPVPLPISSEFYDLDLGAISTTAFTTPGTSQFGAPLAQADLVGLLRQNIVSPAINSFAALTSSEHNTPTVTPSHNVSDISGSNILSNQPISASLPDGSQSSEYLAGFVAGCAYMAQILGRQQSVPQPDPIRPLAQNLPSSHIMPRLPRDDSPSRQPLHADDTAAPPLSKTSRNLEFGVGDNQMQISAAPSTSPLVTRNDAPSNSQSNATRELQESAPKASSHPSTSPNSPRLLQHGRDKKIHKCEECNLTFQRKYKLEDHTNWRHGKAKAHTCDFEGCGKSFTNKANMQRHRKIHMTVVQEFEDSSPT